MSGVSFATLRLPLGFGAGGRPPMSWRGAAADCKVI